MRRLFLVLVLFVGGAALLFAAGQAEPEPEVAPVPEVQTMDEPLQWTTLSEYEEDTGVTIREFGEAPELREKVEAGELEPVEERLPDEPAVMRASEAVGEYGGSYRGTWRGPGNHWLIRHHLREMQVYHDNEGHIKPNLPVEVETLDEGRRYVFHMREGLRWDDGEYIDAYDAEFWWHVKLDDERLPGMYRSEYNINGEEPEIEVIDEYTWQITFPEPHPLFLSIVAEGGRTDMVAPRHYLEQYHVDYAADDEIEAALDEYGFDDWADLFDDRYQIVTNPDRPHWFAFRPVNDPSDSEYRWERNPYYFKVDEEGNQLPYLDTYRREYITEDELAVSLMLGGDLSTHVFPLGEYAILMDNREQGDYEVYPRPNPELAGHPSISLNMTHDDPMVREVFQEADFRKALSVGIDREEINEIVYFGMAEPRQVSFTPESPFYDPEWEQAYVEHDPEFANELLDGLGLEWGDDGYRTWPDGSTLSFTIDLSDSYGEYVDVMELIESHWAEIGVDMDFEVMDSTLRAERHEGNNYDAMTHRLNWYQFPHLQAARVAPDDGSVTRSQWEVEWSRWYISDGERGMEPPEEIQQLYEWDQEARLVVDEERRAELYQKIADWHAENIPQIGVVVPPELYAVQNNLRNGHVFPEDRLYMLDLDEVFVQTLWWDE